MDWAGKQHPVERLVEWLAPALLAGATGWSAKSIGAALPAFSVAAGISFAVGMIAMRGIGRSRSALSPAFEPVVFEADGSQLEELLLDNPIELGDAGSGELLLDDPLVDIDQDARVVRLFARQEPTPGELVARIEDFLGDGPRRAALPAAGRETQPILDAGAALQAALANVRASLK